MFDIKIKVLPEHKKAIRKSVKRGVKWMPKHYPNWLDAIERGEFDIRKGDSCVLGQAAGGYSTGTELGSRLTENALFEDDYGFSISSEITEMFSMSLDTDLVRPEVTDEDFPLWQRQQKLLMELNAAYRDACWDYLQKCWERYFDSVGVVLPDLADA